MIPRSGGAVFETTTATSQAIRMQGNQSVAMNSWAEQRDCEPSPPLCHKIRRLASRWP